jgi:hypothetical protein
VSDELEERAARRRMIEAYLESKRKDLPDCPGGIPRWVFHTDELMVRYIDEGKAVYYRETDSRIGSVSFPTWTKQNRFSRSLTGIAYEPSDQIYAGCLTG